MIIQTFKKFIFLCIAILISHPVRAQFSDVDLLTCNLKKAGQSLPSAWDHLRPLELSDGTFIVRGPVTGRGLCIQNSTIVAAFGVFMVTAELCNSTAEPLLKWVENNRPTLQRATSKSQPEMIAVFGNEEDSLSIFYGKASNQWKQDPTEKQISFFCGVKMSGPQ